MLLTVALFSVAASVAIGVPAVEGIDFVQSVERYTITGTTPRGMFDEMETLGVHDPENGRRNPGYTRADVRFTYNYIGNGSGNCELTNVDVDLDIKITLPQWQPSTEPSRRLEAQWQAFSAALTSHELRHRDIMIEGTKAIRDALDKVPVLPCEEVETRVNAITGPLMEEMWEAGRAYDERTDHGRTEGTWWLIW